jgi:membrane-associated HD superfamily phosphohydrolase
MLADGCEARVRADRPQTEEDMRRIIRMMAQDRLQSGQLSGVSLTLRQLDMIVDSFTETMRGVYHPRIEYPTLGNGIQGEAPTTPRLESPVVPALAPLTEQSKKDDG